MNQNRTPKTNKILRYAKAFYKPAFVTLGIIVFFLFYNAAIVDRSIENLRFSLEVVAQAETLSGAGEVGILVDFNLIDAVVPLEVDSEELVNLEFAQGVLGDVKADRKIGDVESALKEVLEKKELERNRVLRAIDTVVDKVIDFFDFFKGIGKKKVVEIGKMSDDPMILEAKAFERDWKIGDAIANYEEFIKENPEDPGIVMVRLRLGYCYQRLGEYEGSIKIYKQVMDEAYGSRQARVAEQLLNKAKEADQHLTQRENLKRQVLFEADTAEEKQKLLYELGAVDIKLLDFRSAEKNFKEAYKIDPESFIAMKCQFNLAWCYKFQAKLDESISGFKRIVEKNPESNLAMNSKYQMADTYRRKGDMNKAIDLYKEIVEDYSDESVAPVVQFQVGYTYLYDLEDVKKANEAFAELGDKFGDSTIASKAIDDLPAILENILDSGMRFLMEGKFVEAILEFEKLIRLESRYAKAHYYLGLSYMVDEMYDEIVFEEKGRFENTIDAFVMAIKLDPTDPMPFFNLGMVYHFQGRYDDALKYYHQSVKLDPSLAVAYNGIANIYYRKKDVRAIEYFNKYLELRPENVDVEGIKKKIQDLSAM